MARVACGGDSSWFAYKVGGVSASSEWCRWPLPPRGSAECADVMVCSRVRGVMVVGLWSRGESVVRVVVRGGGVVLSPCVLKWGGCVGGVVV